MAFLETGQFCPQDEYDRGINQRITSHEFRQGDLYMVMLSLDADECEAAKYPVRMLDIHRSYGAVAVQFAFLNKNLQEEHVALEPLEDDFIRNCSTATMCRTRDDKRFPILEGYFKDYFEDQFGPALAESQLLTMQ